MSDAGSRSLFKYMSGMNGINEELGRQRGMEDKKERLLSGAECESISHVLWDCPAYMRRRTALYRSTRWTLKIYSYRRFDALDSVGKVSFILRNVLWEENLLRALGFVKEFWEEC